MLSHHLPASAMEIAEEQGWDDLSLGLQILGVLRDNVPDWENVLAAHLKAVQLEENWTKIWGSEL